MSDSSIALNPVIEEPSKPIPSLSAPSISDGVIAKLFRWPSMSVNQKRAYSTPSFWICFRVFARASGSDVARSLLSIMPIGRWLLSPVRVGDLNLQERELSPDAHHDVAVDVAQRA